MELYLHFPYVSMEWCLIEHSDTFDFYPKFFFQPGSLRPAKNMNELFFFTCKTIKRSKLLFLIVE